MAERSPHLSISALNKEDNKWQCNNSLTKSFFIGDLDSVLDCYNLWKKGISVKKSHLVGKGVYYEFEVLSQQN